MSSVDGLLRPPPTRGPPFVPRRISRASFLPWPKAGRAQSQWASTRLVAAARNCRRLWPMVISSTKKRGGQIPHWFAYTQRPASAAAEGVVNAIKTYHRNEIYGIVERAHRTRSELFTIMSQLRKV